MLRRRFADVWHVLAILYIAVLWAIFALDVDGGFGFILRATVLTLVVILAARLLLRGLAVAIRRGFAVPHPFRAQIPYTEARATRYLPVLERLLTAVVLVLPALPLFQLRVLAALNTRPSSIDRRP